MNRLLESFLIPCILFAGFGAVLAFIHCLWILINKYGPLYPIIIFAIFVFIGIWVAAYKGGNNAQGKF